MRFFLGTHMPGWLGTVDVPLFVSRRRLEGRKTLPRALAPWALDSGGFSELSMYGEWRTIPQQYVDEVRRWRDGIGQLQWAAIQDWMCEPWILAKTMPTTPPALAVAWHQSLTIQSLLTLRDLAPDIPWTPVLQGWGVGDYLRHVEMYDRAGIDLRMEPIVGVGSVCRREGTSEAEWIMRRLASLGLRLHGFGVKISGLRRYHDCLASADSMAWSFAARHRPPMDGCSHKTCANCPKWALQWRAQLLASMDAPESQQLSLWGAR